MTFSDRRDVLGSPAVARINLGSYRDRRPAAADPLPRAQPEQPQRTFLAGPLTHCRRVQPEKSEPERAQRDLNVWLGAAGPHRQTRDGARQYAPGAAFGSRGRRRPPATLVASNSRVMRQST